MQQQNSTNQLSTVHSQSIQQQDLLALTNSIKDLINVGVEPKNIAVVYSMNQQGEKLFSHLLQNQIPFNCNTPLNVLQCSLSSQLMIILKYLAAESDIATSGDNLLFQVLHFKWFNISNIDITKLTAEVADRRFGKDKTSLRQHLLNKANPATKDLFTQPIEGIKIASDSIEKLLAELPDLTMPQLFQRLINETGLLHYTLQHPAKEWYETILHAWIDFIQTEQDKNPSITLNQLIATIDRIQKEKQFIPLIKSCNDLNGVHVLISTAFSYSSFDYVFKVGDHVTTNEHNFEHSGATIEPFNADFIDRVLNKFVMNVSALNTYLSCPLQFYFDYIVRVPPAKSTAFAFGSAVHYALQLLFEKMRKKNVFPTVDTLLNDFKQYMIQNRMGFTEETFNQKIHHGNNILTNYYYEYVAEWNKIVVIERTLKNIMLGEVPIKGKVDKLEFNGKNVNIVDYKTGNVEKALEKLQPPNDFQPNGGDYWRQAVFYKILVDNYEGGKWQAVSSEFDFIEPNKDNAFQKVKLVISPADIATVTHQLTVVWAKIQDRQFYKGCGKSTCGWCGFVKENEFVMGEFSLPGQTTVRPWSDGGLTG